MKIETRYVKLVAKKEEPGGYVVLVFLDLTSEKYIMCTRLPNWETEIPDFNIPGFLQVREVISGKDSWYDGERNHYYKYTALYFWDFVKEKQKIDTELKLD